MGEFDFTGEYTPPKPIEPDWEDEDEDRPRRRRRKEPQGHPLWVVLAMLFLTLVLPILGLILGIVDMAGSNQKKRAQGGLFVIAAIIWMLALAATLQ